MKTKMKDLFYDLKDGDEIFFIKKIMSVDMYYKEIIFYDNPKNSIKKELFSLHRNNNIDINRTIKNFAHVIVNNEYKIIKYGFTLDLIFVDYLSYYKIKISKKILYHLNSYSGSYLIKNSNQELDQELDQAQLLKNEQALKQNIKNNYWDSKRKISYVYNNILKNNNFGKIPQLKNHLRTKKLNNLI